MSQYITNIPVKDIVADSNQAVTYGFDVLACCLNPVHFSVVFCTSPQPAFRRNFQAYFLNYILHLLPGRSVKLRHFKIKCLHLN